MAVISTLYATLALLLVKSNLKPSTFLTGLNFTSDAFPLPGEPWRLSHFSKELFWEQPAEGKTFLGHLNRSL